MSTEGNLKFHKLSSSSSLSLSVFLNNILNRCSLIEKVISKFLALVSPRRWFYLFPLKMNALDQRNDNITSDVRRYDSLDPRLNSIYSSLFLNFLQTIIDRARDESSPQSWEIQCFSGMEEGSERNQNILPLNLLFSQISHETQ